MSTFQDLTDLRRDSVSNALKHLEAMRIIAIQRGDGGRSNEYLFNKYCDTWLTSDQLPLMGSTENRTTSDEAGSTENRTTLSPTHATPEPEAKIEGSTRTRTSPVVMPTTEPVKTSLLKTSIKEEEASSTKTLDENATELLQKLVSLKHWRTTADDDVSDEDMEWLEQFMQKFPEFSIDNVTACADYYSGRKEAKNRGDWKNRLRNWMVRERLFPATQGFRTTPPSG